MMLTLTWPLVACIPLLKFAALTSPGILWFDILDDSQTMVMLLPPSWSLRHISHIREGRQLHIYKSGFIFPAPNAPASLSGHYSQSTISSSQRLLEKSRWLFHSGAMCFHVFCFPRGIISKPSTRAQNLKMWDSWKFSPNNLQINIFFVDKGLEILLAGGITVSVSLKLAFSATDSSDVEQRFILSSPFPQLSAVFNHWFWIRWQCSEHHTGWRCMCDEN